MRRRATQRIILDEAGPRELVGVDPDPSEVALARALAIYSAVHVAGGAAVPEPDRSFDWVLSNSVLEHIGDIDPVLAEVGRLLKPGGVFLLTVPGPDFHSCLRGPLVPGASRATYLRRLDARLALVRCWGPAEWETALSRHGVHVVESSAYLSGEETRRWESISRATSGVLYALGGGRWRPIEIQRGLGMRKRGRRMPVALAIPLAAALAAGLGPADGRYACWLVKAVKDK